MTDLQPILNGLAYLLVNTSEKEGSLSWPSRKLSASVPVALINANGEESALPATPLRNGESKPVMKRTTRSSGSGCFLRLVADDHETQ